MLFRQCCFDSAVSTVLFRQCCFDSVVLIVLFRQYCFYNLQCRFDSAVLLLLFLQCCFDSAVSTVLFRQCCFYSAVTTVLFLQQWCFDSSSSDYIVQYEYTTGRISGQSEASSWDSNKCCDCSVPFVHDISMWVNFRHHTSSRLLLLFKLLSDLHGTVTPP